MKVRNHFIASRLILPASNLLTLPLKLTLVLNTLTCKNFGYVPKVNEKTNELIAVYEKDYKLNSESADELRKMFIKYVPDTTTRRAEEDVNDGGGFQISYVHSSKDTVKLTVVNPSRNNKYKTDFQQIDKFFEVAYESSLIQ